MTVSAIIGIVNGSNLSLGDLTVQFVIPGDAGTPGVEECWRVALSRVAAGITRASIKWSHGSGATQKERTLMVNRSDDLGKA